jgi:hypothetical protein
MDFAMDARLLAFALIILALDVWAIYKTWTSGASRASRLAWSGVILLLPVLGLIIWSLAGPRISKPDVYRHEPP